MRIVLAEEDSPGLADSLAATVGVSYGIPRLVGEFLHHAPEIRPQNDKINQLQR